MSFKEKLGLWATLLFFVWIFGGFFIGIAYGRGYSSAKEFDSDYLAKRKNFRDLIYYSELCCQLPKIVRTVVAGFSAILYTIVMYFYHTGAIFTSYFRNPRGGFVSDLRKQNRSLQDIWNTIISLGYKSGRHK